MWQDLKKFIMRGNVLDLAVGIIIGAAFTSVVNSLVKDIIMPPIGLLLSGVDFSNLFINLSSTRYATLAEAQAAGAPTINYGVFLNNVVSFVIVAITIFLLVRVINTWLLKPESPPAPTKACPYCKTTIPLTAVRCPQCTSHLEETHS